MNIDGTLHAFTGVINGHYETYGVGSIAIDADDVTTVINFDGYVDGSVEPLDEAAARQRIAAIEDTEADDDEAYDEDGDYYEGYDDYNPQVRQPLVFGDRHIKITVDATFPNTQFIQDLSDKVLAAVRDEGIDVNTDPAYDEDLGRETDAALRADDIDLDDERVAGALLTVVQALTDDAVTVHGVQCVDGRGNAIQAPAFTRLLTA